MLPSGFFRRGNLYSLRIFSGTKCRKFLTGKKAIKICPVMDAVQGKRKEIKILKLIVKQIERICETRSRSDRPFLTSFPVQDGCAGRHRPGRQQRRKVLVDSLRTIGRIPSVRIHSVDRRRRRVGPDGPDRLEEGSVNAGPRRVRLPTPVVVAASSGRVRGLGTGQAHDSATIRIRRRRPLIKTAFPYRGGPSHPDRHPLHILSRLPFFREKEKGGRFVTCAQLCGHEEKGELTFGEGLIKTI